MSQIGPRIICDQDGEILLILGKSVGENRKVITNLSCVDLDYGFVPDNKRIVKVDIQTMLPVLEDIEPTEEQQKIKMLEEDIELLKADSETGGIL